MTQQIPATQNAARGFWGAMGEQAQTAWPQAMQAIAEATEQDLHAVRAFLDSRFGRHFADDVHNALHTGDTLIDAIHAATRRWMGWTIRSQTSKQYGIPDGVAYLTGFVILSGINEELLAE